MKINTYVSSLYGSEVMVSEGAFEEVLREMRCNHDSTLFRGQTQPNKPPSFAPWRSIVW